MRMMPIGLAAFLLASCLSPDEEQTKPPVLKGAFKGDHGDLTRIRSFESELILGEDGSFRYFLVDSNSVSFTSKGNWKIANGEMISTKIARSYNYHGAFRNWDTLAASDTSLLRNMTDSSFERLEASWDSQFVPTAKWVKYRQFQPENPVQAGTYRFSETFPDGIDSTVTDSASTVLEIARGGAFVQRIYTNNSLTSMDVDSQWTQTGSFLISSHNYYCSYDSGKAYCGNSPADFEYVARLQKIEDGSFNLWIPPGTAFQVYPFWAVFRKLTEPELEM